MHKISTVVEHNDNTHDNKTNDRKNVVKIIKDDGMKG